MAVGAAQQTFISISSKNRSPTARAISLPNRPQTSHRECSRGLLTACAPDRGSDSARRSKPLSPKLDLLPGWCTKFLAVLLLFWATVGCVQTQTLLPDDTIYFVALLPSNFRRFPFAYQIVLPALELAVSNVTSVGGPLQGRHIQVHLGDTECSSAAAMNQMFNFYIQKKAHVFFGPCCDYAAAPVARQLHYWQLPMLTAGAIARDFAAGKKYFYDFLTRVGTTVNSVVDFLLEIMRQFKWKRIKQVYDPFAQSLMGDKVCHIMTDGIHYGLASQDIIPDIEQDYEKFEEVGDFLDRMAEEIGDWAGGMELAG